MGIVLYLIRTVVEFVLYGLEIIMLIRAVMSFVAPTAGGQFANFIYGVTEFVVATVRSLIDRFEFARRCPFDISFLVTYLIIVLLSSII